MAGRSGEFGIDRVNAGKSGNLEVAQTPRGWDVQQTMRAGINKNTKRLTVDKVLSPLEALCLHLLGLGLGLGLHHKDTEERERNESVIIVLHRISQGWQKTYVDRGGPHPNFSIRGSM